MARDPYALADGYGDPAPIQRRPVHKARNVRDQRSKDRKARTGR